MALSKNAKALAIAKSIVLPGSNDQVRINDGFGASETAVAGPYIDAPLPFLTSGTSSYAAVYLFKDIFRNYVFYDPNTANSDSKYVWNWPGIDNWVSIYPGATNPWNPNYFDVDPAQSYQPHGDILWCGIGDRRFVWLDKGCSVTWRVATANVIVNTAFVHSFYWNGSDAQEAHYTAIPATVVGATFSYGPVGNSGYYAFDFVGLDGAATSDLDSAWITGYSNVGVWCHRGVPGVVDNMRQTKSLRITGEAITIRNTTAQEYLNGQACVVQMGKGTDPYDIMPYAGPSATLYQTLSSLKGGTVRTFKKSFYAFVRPLQQEDLDFQITNPSVKGNDFPATGFPLQTQRNWVAIVTLVSAPGEGIPGTNAQFRLEEAIEFLTIDTWKNTRKPEADEDDANAACKAVARIPYCFSDPSASLPSDIHALLLE